VIYAYIDKYMHTNIHICNTYIQIYICVYINVRVRVSVCVHDLSFVSTYIHNIYIMYMYVLCVYIYVYIYMQVTTNKQAPTVLQKIGDSLYRRVDLADEDLRDFLRPAPDATGATGPWPDADVLPDGPPPAPPPRTSAPPLPASQGNGLHCELVFGELVNGERGGRPGGGEGGGGPGDGDPLNGRPGDGDGGGGGGGPGDRAEVDGHDDDLCCICLDGRNEAVLLECGHGGLCVVCAQVSACARHSHTHIHTHTHTYSMMLCTLSLSLSLSSLFLYTHTHTHTHFLSICLRA
jgi:hypothetical protein